MLTVWALLERRTASQGAAKFQPFPPSVWYYPLNHHNEDTALIRAGSTIGLF
jgi:hypothetical protein